MHEDNFYMKWMPFYKLFSTLFRAIVFTFVMILSEVSMGSVNLLSFVSIVTVVGIIIGLGSQDSLLGASKNFFYFYKKFSPIFIILLILCSFFLNFESFLINSLISALYFGSIFWMLGEIRIYSLVYYEAILSSYMAILWSIYVFLIPFETENFSILSLVFLLISILVFLFSIFLRFKNNKQRKIVSGGFAAISISKLSWEVIYSAFTRSPFLFWNFFVALPSIFSYLYYFCELLSAVISQYQSKFLSSNQDKDHSNLYYKLMAFLTFGYIVAIFFLIILFNFQEEILKFLISSSFFSNILYRILSLSNIDLILCITCSLVILLMQWVAYARYAFKLHANISIVLVFGTIFLVNSFLIYFFIGPLGKEGLIYLTLITILILILSLIYFLVKIEKNYIS